MTFVFVSETALRQQFLPGDLGTRLPDVIGAAAGCFGVAVFPRALRDGAGAIGEQLVPEVAGETSRAVWWKNKLRSSALGGMVACVGCE